MIRHTSSWNNNVSYIYYYQERGHWQKSYYSNWWGKIKSKECSIVAHPSFLWPLVLCHTVHNNIKGVYHQTDKVVTQSILVYCHKKMSYPTDGWSKQLFWKEFVQKTHFEPTLLVVVLLVLLLSQIVLFVLKITLTQFRIFIL